MIRREGGYYKINIYRLNNPPHPLHPPIYPSRVREIPLPSLPLEYTAQNLHDPIPCVFRGMWGMWGIVKPQDNVLVGEPLLSRGGFGGCGGVL